MLWRSHYGALFSTQYASNDIIEMLNFFWKVIIISISIEILFQLPILCLIEEDSYGEFPSSVVLIQIINSTQLFP